MKLNKNQIFSLCLIAFAGVSIYLVNQVESTFKVSNGDIGPRFIPIAAAVCLIICSIGKFISEAKKEECFLTKEGWEKAISVILILMAYLIGITWLGYIISTLLATEALVWCMREDRKLSILGVSAFSIITTAVIYFAFKYAMHIMLPVGRFFS